MALGSTQSWGSEPPTIVWGSSNFSVCFLLTPSMIHNIIFLHCYALNCTVYFLSINTLRISLDNHPLFLRLDFILSYGGDTLIPSYLQFFAINVSFRNYRYIEISYGISFIESQLSMSEVGREMDQVLVINMYMTIDDHSSDHSSGGAGPSLVTLPIGGNTGLIGPTIRPITP